MAVNKAGRFRRGLMDPFIVEQVGLNSTTILDLGCGAAEYHEMLLANAHIERIVGMDNSE